MGSNEVLIYTIPIMGITINRVFDEPCCACGNRECEEHHILPKGAFPQYKHCKWNKVPLCRKHHNLAHHRAHGRWFRMKLAEKLPQEIQELHKDYLSSV